MFLEWYCTSEVAATVFSHSNTAVFKHSGVRIGISQCLNMCVMFLKFNLCLGIRVTLMVEYLDLLQSEQHLMHMPSVMVRGHFVLMSIRTNFVQFGLSFWSTRAHLTRIGQFILSLVN